MPKIRYLKVPTTKLDRYHPSQSLVNENLFSRTRKPKMTLPDYHTRRMRRWHRLHPVSYTVREIGPDGLLIHTTVVDDRFGDPAVKELLRFPYGKYSEKLPLISFLDFSFLSDWIIALEDKIRMLFLRNRYRMFIRACEMAGSLQPAQREPTIFYRDLKDNKRLRA